MCLREVYSRPSDGLLLGQRRRRLTGNVPAMGCDAGRTLNRHLVDMYELHRSYGTVHGMAWHGMAWHGMAWHGMAWHGIALHCIALHCIALHCIALHCIIISRLSCDLI